MIYIHTEVCVNSVYVKIFERIPTVDRVVVVLFGWEINDGGRKY